MDPECLYVCVPPCGDANDRDDPSNRDAAPAHIKACADAGVLTPLAVVARNRTALDVRFDVSVNGRPAGSVVVRALSVGSLTRDALTGHQLRLYGGRSTVRVDATYGYADAGVRGDAPPAPPAGGAPLPLQVRHICGDRIAVDARDSWTVGDVCVAVQRASGVPSWRQRLVPAGAGLDPARVLDPAQTLAHYGLRPNTMLHLVPMRSGEPPRAPATAFCPLRAGPSFTFVRDTTCT